LYLANGYESEKWQSTNIKLGKFCRLQIVDNILANFPLKKTCIRHADPRRREGVKQFGTALFYVFLGKIKWNTFAIAGVEQNIFYQGTFPCQIS
jgi:hypothetical protein